MGSSWASDGKLSRNGRVAVERGMRGGEGRLVSSSGVGRRAASVSRRGWRDLIAFRGGRGRAGSGRCPKGVVRDTAGRAVDGWRAGIIAFAINGRCREGDFALPRAAFLSGCRDSVSLPGDLKRHQAKFYCITRCVALKRTRATFPCAAPRHNSSPSRCAARADLAEISRRTRAVIF